MTGSLSRPSGSRSGKDPVAMKDSAVELAPCPKDEHDGIRDQISHEWRLWYGLDEDPDKDIEDYPTLCRQNAPD